MASLLVVLYAVHAISPPSGMTVDLTPPQQYNWAVSPLQRLPGIALSHGGAVAMLIHPSGLSEQTHATKLLVIRTDGTQLVLARPGDRELADAFGQGPVPGWTPSYPYAYFDGVRLARDGTPFVTVASTFSGAYSGINTVVFSWNGKKWTHQVTTDWRNVTIGAVDTMWRAAYNANYWNTFVNLDEAKTDHYHEFWTFLLNGQEHTKIGYGESTAMSGDTVVGYSAGLTQSAKPPPLPTFAWEWLGGKLVKLGPGVAYGVNASHDAVGDNEPALGGDGGVPVLWHEGQTIPLSFTKGSALSIGDDGTIVGQVGDDGFLVRGDDPQHNLLLVDTLLAQREWHVSAVYAIAASGRLLAVGHRAHEGPRVLILDPD